jgi:hypothetical protein
MREGTFVCYHGRLAVVVRDGARCTAEAGGDLDDHLGLWFGEITAEGRPVVWTIPAEYVEVQPVVDPSFAH